MQSVLDEIMYRCLDSCENEDEIKLSKNYVNNEMGSHYFVSHRRRVEQVTDSENTFWTKENKCEREHN